VSRPDHNDVLQKLIRIKKQRAKQQLGDLQKAHVQIQSELQEIQQAFLQLGDAPDDFGDWKTSVQNKCPERLLSELENLRYKETAVARGIAAAEQELRISLHARKVLSEPENLL